MVGLKPIVFLVLVSLTILPTLATYVVAQAIGRPILVDWDWVTILGSLSHSVIVAFLACFERQELRLCGGGRLIVLALRVLWVTSPSVARTAGGLERGATGATAQRDACTGCTQSRAGWGGKVTDGPRGSH